MGQVSSGDRGIGLLTSQFPTASHHQRDQGTRAFTKTLEVTIPPWGPAWGKTVSVQDPAASLPTLHTVLCIAGSPNLHCTVHFLPLLQPQFDFILNPHFHVPRGTNICIPLELYGGELERREWINKTGLLLGPQAHQPHQGTPANKQKVLQPIPCARCCLRCGDMWILPDVSVCWVSGASMEPKHLVLLAGLLSQNSRTPKGVISH